MVQIKFITRQTPSPKELEERVNTYLRENASSIEVMDIKYSFSPRDNGWCTYSAMIIYQTKDA